MRCVNANLLFSQITSTLVDINFLIESGANNSNQAYLAKYLTVFITGIYEQAIEEIIWEYATSANMPELENFVANNLDKQFRNPDMPNIIALVKRFSSSWTDDIKNMEDKYKDAINSIVNNKNLIAHGSPSTITVLDIKSFHEDAAEIIKKIDSLFLGS